jgi:uncharacterized protein (UPF0333 family)
MTVWKLAVALVLIAAIGVVGYDGVEILNAHRDVRDAASATASAAAQAIASTKDRAKASAIADKTAKARGDVVTAFTYDPVAAKITVTVSGNASSLVLHLFDKNLTDNIRATATARPG